MTNVALLKFLALVVAAATVVVTTSAHENHDNNVVVDLSQDLVASPHVNTNPGATTVMQVAESDPLIRTVVVLEHGEIVVDYVRDDVDPTVPNQAFSTTKSWISLLTGLAIESGLLSLEGTLADIWPDDNDNNNDGDNVWSDLTAEPYNLTVAEIEFRKNVTIESLLTMSSGLISSPAEFNQTNDFFEDGGGAGGADLRGSLSYGDLGEEGVFSYFGTSNILSYVIQEVTGMSPREYAAETVFPSLGINDEDIGWWQNEDGMEYGFHGLELTPLQMAKFGQLYLQHGQTGPNDNYLLPSEWLGESTSPQVVAMVFDPVSNMTQTVGYGYLFWVPGNFSCALGLGGQDICVSYDLDRVVIQQKDLNPNNTMAGGLEVAPVALDSSLSYGVENVTLDVGMEEVVAEEQEEEEENENVGDATTDNTTDASPGDDAPTVFSAGQSLRPFVPFMLGVLALPMLAFC